MIQWLRARSIFGLARGWLALAAFAIGALALLWILGAERADDRRNQDIGAAVQREADMHETLKRTEQAHEARSEIRDDRGDARYDQCLRTARTAANCQRFLHRGSAS